MSTKKSGYGGYNRYYSSTSEARSLDSLPAYETRWQAGENKKTVRKRTYFRKKKLVTVFMNVGQTHAKFSPYSVVTIGLVFLCALGLALSYAALLNKQLYISSLNTELKQIREQNLVVQSEISKNYDIKEIEKIATTRLGMSKPKAHQIVHINVPKQSYVIQFEETGGLVENETLLAKLKSFVFN